MRGDMTWGAWLLWTLDRINFWFSLNNFCVKFKTKTTNVSRESSIYENSFSSSVEKMWLFSVFSVVPLFSHKRNHQPWRKVTLGGNSIIHSLACPKQNRSQIGLAKTRVAAYLSLGKRSSRHSRCRAASVHRTGLALRRGRWVLTRLPGREQPSLTCSGAKLLRGGDLFSFPSTGNSKCTTQQQHLLLSCPWASCKAVSLFA